MVANLPHPSNPFSLFFFCSDHRSQCSIHRLFRSALVLLVLLFVSSSVNECTGFSKVNAFTLSLSLSLCAPVSLSGTLQREGLPQKSPHLHPPTLTEAI